MENNNTNIGKIPMPSENGRIVGWIANDVLWKNAKESRHMLRRPRGWAWDACILEKAERLGASHTEIHEQEAKVVYRAKLEDFRCHGVKIDRGFGSQICLPIRYFQVQRPGNENPIQIKLF